MVLHFMLDSYIGTFDHHGLRSLKSENDVRSAIFSRRPGQFWAVLDKSLVPSINQAIAKGDSISALQIVFQQARDMGSI